MSFRRFVNLISGDSQRCLYSLRRIDMSRFFVANKKNNSDAAAPAAMVDCSSLPDPAMNFFSSERADHQGTMEFMLVDKNKVVAADGTGGALMYDTDEHAIRALPGHGMMRPYSFSVAVGNNVYNIDITRDCSRKRRFESLVYNAPMAGQRANWHWRPLPPPPNDDGDCDNTRIDSCAVVADGLEILFTARARDKGSRSRTYSFNTRELLWSDTPRDWVLPFSGCPEYIPELGGLWFGISSKDHGNVLCACDLAAPCWPPVVTTLDLAGAGAPRDWCLVSARSVYLGSGKFCIARFFNVAKTHFCPENQLTYFEDHNFAVLAGVEVVLNSDNDDGPKFHVIKHRAERYMFIDNELHWLF